MVAGITVEGILGKKIESVGIERNWNFGGFLNIGGRIENHPKLQGANLYFFLGSFSPGIAVNEGHVMAAWIILYLEKLRTKVAIERPLLTTTTKLTLKQTESKH